ncbi:hypothetical protein [Oleidesulfovibrio sp.]|uniref:hypothetical protein n=1 Tax=Oleidesulfovibrio sp. TaxID=2909707 RepID=UPI003A8623DC
MTEKSFAQGLRQLIFCLAAALLFVYGFLPLLTDSVPILGRMSHYLNENGIDPTRYYFTDIEAVTDAENHMEEVMMNVKKPALPGEED